jgi:hypothetical protein
MALCASETPATQRTQPHAMYTPHQKYRRFFMKFARGFGNVVYITSAFLVLLANLSQTANSRALLNVPHMQFLQEDPAGAYAVLH